jgi:hypothetical protein
LLASLEASIPPTQKRRSNLRPRVTFVTAPRQAQPTLRLVVDNTRTSQSGKVQMKHSICVIAILAGDSKGRTNRLPPSGKISRAPTD